MSIFQPSNPAINFKYSFTGALSFRAKLLLAMMLVVLAVTTATVYLAEKNRRANQQQVLDPRTAYQVVSILEGVIQRGTGVAIRVLGKPLAGKTGTSSDFRDAWFVGFSPDLAVGVFIGKDSFQTLGQGEQGALAAAPIFRDFMKEALTDQPPTPFRIPQGIALVPTNPLSGAVVQQGSPGSILEAFKAGTEPGAGYMVSDIEDPGIAVPTSATASDTPQGATPAAASGPSSAPATIGTGTGGLY